MFAHPKTRIEPTEIAPDTFVIHDHHGEGEAPIAVALNAMVIRAAEPVVVDTGVADNREQYLADVFSVVEPEDIRWVFVSHDDIDHTGNLNALLELAPNATVIVNWFMADRMGSTLAAPPTRQRWIGDGESFEAGDRTLHAVRPPVYDSPTTRGLYDSKTGVYWTSDGFASPMLTPTATTSDSDPGFLAEGQHMFDRYVSPWLELVDDRRFQLEVDRVQALAPTAMVGCHTPAILGRDRVEMAIAATRSSPTAEVQPQPDQAVLDQIQLAIEGMAA
jgi:flavorubredoxin